MKSLYGERLRQYVGQGSRYLLVGGAAWLVDISIFSILYPSLGVALAQVVSRTIGAVITFFGHKDYVFLDRRYHGSVLRRQVLSYAMLWLLSFILSLLGILWLAWFVNVNEVVAKVGVETIIVVVNFLISKRMIFR